MKLRIKLVLAFSMIFLSMLVVNQFIVSASGEEMKNSVGRISAITADSLIAQIDMNVYSRIEEIQKYGTRATVQANLIGSNKEFESIADISNFIDEKDREWISNDDTDLFAQEIVGNELSADLRSLIKFYEEKYGYKVIAEVFVTNKYGAVIGMSGKTTDYKQFDEDWWQVAKTGGFHVSDIEFDESSGVYSVSICVKVDDENKNFIGVIKSVVDVEELFRIVRNADETPDFRSQKIILLDGTGNKIYQTENNLTPYDTPPFTFHGRSNVTSGFFLENVNKTKLLVAYAISHGYRDFKGIGWTAVISYDAEEIDRPVNKIIYNLTALTLVEMLFALFIILIIYRAIAGPLGTLTNFSKDVALGKLDRKIDLSSRDEIGDLALAFNNMVTELKKSRDEIKKHESELKEKVNERTMDLHDKIVELTNTKNAVLNMMEDMEETNKNLTKAEKDLKNSMKRLKVADIKKDEFMSIAAHELKTPMTSIHGFAQLLRNKDVINDPQKRDKYLDIILKETVRLADLINDVLDLSRIDMETIKFEIEQVKLHDIIDSVKTEMSIQVNEKGLEAEYAVGKNVSSISTDREKLTEILTNLINNAVKYTPKGKITVMVLKEADDIHFIVKDTGIGIKKEDQSRIFTRFYQVDSSYTRSAGGVGLGLSLCKELVTAMGGKMWFSSEYGKGSEFHFTLPVKCPLPKTRYAQKINVLQPKAAAGK